MSDTEILAAAAAYRQAYEAAERMPEDDPRQIIATMEAVSRYGGDLLRAARGDPPVWTDVMRKLGA